MAARYAILRGEFRKRGIDQEYLAPKLQRGITYVSDRMTGKMPWSQEDMYIIMDMLQWPYDRMHELFPRGGVAYKGGGRRKDDGMLKALGTIFERVGQEVQNFNPRTE